MMMRRSGTLFAAALTLGTAACRALLDSGDVVCTRIGCSSGLTIRFDAVPPPGAYRVELLPAGEGGPRYVVECPDASRCTGGATFPGFTGDYVVVRVTTARGVLTREVRPTYTESRPNGPDCPPVCQQATVAVPLPA
jgi:hypothetical protein